MPKSRNASSRTTPAHRGLLMVAGILMILTALPFLYEGIVAVGVGSSLNQLCGSSCTNATGLVSQVSMVIVGIGVVSIILGVAYVVAGILVIARRTVGWAVGVALSALVVGFSAWLYVVSPLFIILAGAYVVLALLTLLFLILGRKALK